MTIVILRNSPNKRNIIIILLLLSGLTTACNPFAGVEARAYLTRTEASQDAADRTEARRHQTTINRQQETEREANSQTRIDTKRAWLWGQTIIGLFLLASVAGSASYGFAGLARAGLRRANLHAGTVRLDRATRQFPLVFDNPLNPRFLINVNSGQVIRLSAPQTATPQLVAAAGLTQVAGAIAQEAAKSGDPAGVAMVNPPVVTKQLVDGGQTNETL